MATQLTASGAVPRELPLVAGHLALDLVDTVDDPEGPARFDHLSTYAGLLAWAVRVEVLHPEDAARLERRAAASPGAADAALQRAHALRGVLDDVFTAAATGTGPTPEQWAELQPFAVDALASAHLAPGDGHVELGWTLTDDLHALLRPIASAAVDLLRADDLHRVKRCAGCPWLFLDRSRNASRRWCAMDDCGKHEKIQRYVARRAARRTSRSAG